MLSIQISTSEYSSNPRPKKNNFFLAMIVNAIQKSNSIYIYKDKGPVMVRGGFLISFNSTTYSYIATKTSKVIIVCDEKGHRIKSFNSPTYIKSGLGW